MIVSRPIDIGGRFVGVAVTHAQGWSFIAVDPGLEDLHGATFRSLDEARRVARLVQLRNAGGRTAAPQVAA